MMEYKEFTGKDIAEALTNASVSFGVTSDRISYDVIDKGSTGLLGLGSRSAVIKATVIDENVQNDLKEEVTEDTQENNFVQDTEEDSSDSLDLKALSDVEDACSEFIEGICKEMDIDVHESYFYDVVNNTLNVELTGDDMGIIIGKRGQTLDSLQYLTSLAINRKSSKYIHVRLDTENYRDRRRKTLENLAHNVAYKVKKTEKPVALESMNSYERRIIHAALSDDPHVATHSEGEDPYRHVVVTLK
jgi:spoIIIJ-associated protein